MKKNNKIIMIILILIIMIFSILLICNKNEFPFKNIFNKIKISTDKILNKKDIDNIYLGKDNYLLKKYEKPVNNKKIVKKLNDLYKELNYINMNLMLVPTSISINSDLLPKNAFTYNEKKTIDYIYDNINFDSINVYDVLKLHNKDYQMYYRSDINWTTFSAYYAYLEFAKINNINAYNLDSFDINVLTEKFNGNLVNKTNDYLCGNDTIYQFELKNSSYELKYHDTKKKTNSLYNLNSIKNKYNVFLDGNHDLIEITNKKNNNNKELIIIKDSYANSIIPFLINHYEKIYVIDLEYYNGSLIKLINDNKNIKDLLVLYNVNELDEKLSLIKIK
ncbi:MAG TPA: DHHW family protein [Bacilli bacterium]|nr:DHHW family protein [Bacilli bacterium]